MSGTVIRETATPLATATVSATPTPTATIREPRAVVSGFELEVLAEGIREPVGAAYDDAGTLYIVRRDGDLIRFVGGKASVLARGFYNPEGMLWFHDSLVLLSRGRLDTLQDWNGDGEPERITSWADELPSRGWPAAALTTDGERYLYIGIGSDCSTCKGTDDLRGTVLVLDLRTGRAPIFARGVGAVHGLAHLPRSDRTLLVATLGGDDGSPGRVVIIPQGADLGWPSCLVSNPGVCGNGDGVLVNMDIGRVPTGLTVTEGQGSLSLLFGSYEPELSHSGKVSAVKLSDSGHLEGDVQDVVVGLSQPVSLVRVREGVLVTDPGLGRVYLLRTP